jgi:NAD(P)-dependent dehydrogenase (short-subunit alcohol dehydrogenase family)
MVGPAPRLDGRIALITGASRGIGAAVARRFAAEGAHLILVARTVGGLEEVDDQVQAAGGRAATLVPIDLTEGEKIDQMAAAVYERFGHLDILVGNAATLGILSPVGHIDPDVWDQAFALNVTANWRLIRGFDPLLRASAAGRAIFVTSGAAHNPRAYWSAYAATKAALEAMVICYAGETAKSAPTCARPPFPVRIRRPCRAPIPSPKLLSPSPRPPARATAKSSARSRAVRRKGSCPCA